MSIVGKCPSCHFELDWKRVENDLQGDGECCFGVRGPVTDAG